MVGDEEQPSAVPPDQGGAVEEADGDVIGEFVLHLFQTGEDQVREAEQAGDAERDTRQQGSGLALGQQKVIHKQTAPFLLFHGIDKYSTAASERQALVRMKNSPLSALKNVVYWEQRKRPTRGEELL